MTNLAHECSHPGVAFDHTPLVRYRTDNKTDKSREAGNLADVISAGADALRIGRRPDMLGLVAAARRDADRH